MSFVESKYQVELEQACTNVAAESCRTTGNVLH